MVLPAPRSQHRGNLSRRALGIVSRSWRSVDRSSRRRCLFSHRFPCALFARGRGVAPWPSLVQTELCQTATNHLPLALAGDGNRRVL